MGNTSNRGDGNVFYYFCNKNQRFRFYKEKINYNVHIKRNRYYIYDLPN